MCASMKGSTSSLDSPALARPPSETDSSAQDETSPDHWDMPESDTGAKVIFDAEKQLARKARRVAKTASDPTACAQSDLFSECYVPSRFAGQVRELRIVRPSFRFIYGPASDEDSADLIHSFDQHVETPEHPEVECGMEPLPKVSHLRVTSPAESSVEQRTPTEAETHPTETQASESTAAQSLEGDIEAQAAPDTSPSDRVSFYPPPQPRYVTKPLPSYRITPNPTTSALSASGASSSRSSFSRRFSSLTATCPSAATRAPSPSSPRPCSACRSARFSSSGWPTRCPRRHNAMSSCSSLPWSRCS